MPSHQAALVCHCRQLTSTQFMARPTTATSIPTCFIKTTSSESKWSSCAVPLSTLAKRSPLARSPAHGRTSLRSSPQLRHLKADASCHHHEAVSNRGVEARGDEQANPVDDVTAENFESIMRRIALVKIQARFYDKRTSCNAVSLHC